LKHSRNILVKTFAESFGYNIQRMLQSKRSQSRRFKKVLKTLSMRTFLLKHSQNVFVKTFAERFSYNIGRMFQSKRSHS